MQSIKVKVLTVFMSVIMVFSLFPALSSNAATSGKCGDNLSYSVSNGTLYISGTGAMYDFTYNKTNNTLNVPWGSELSKINKIVIGDGVTSIGKYAFFGETNVTSIEWPTNGSLKSIRDYAFCGLIRITSIQLPKGLTSIGYCAFESCYDLVSVKFPSTLKTIGKGAFAYCYDLTKVWIPSKVTTIGNCAFQNCQALKSVTGGAGLVKIGNAAFRSCYKLSTFKISSKKLKKIDKCAFIYTSKLKTLYLKKTTKLTKKGVRGSLYLSSVKTVKVKKSKVKKYKKIFKKSNSGKKVKVKK